MPTIHLLIKGKVQGVFYRASARENAEQLGLTGWIKNTPEGHVESMVSGEQPQLTAFCNWCRQGPSRARVEELIWTPVSPVTFSSFEILR